MKDMAPKLSRVALLVNSINAFSTSFEPSMRVAAQPFGIRTSGFGVARLHEIEPAFRSMVQWGGRGDRHLIRRSLWFERNRLPAMCRCADAPAMSRQAP
jgi:hypothetical protein